MCLSYEQLSSVETAELRSTARELALALRVYKPLLCLLDLTSFIPHLLLFIPKENCDPIHGEDLPKRFDREHMWEAAHTNPTTFRKESLNYHRQRSMSTPPLRLRIYTKKTNLGFSHERLGGPKHKATLMNGVRSLSFSLITETKTFNTSLYVRSRAVTALIPKTTWTLAHEKDREDQKTHHTWSWRERSGVPIHSRETRSWKPIMQDWCCCVLLLPQKAMIDLDMFWESV